MDVAFICYFQGQGLSDLPPLALYVNSIGHNWEVYLNGRLMDREMYPRKGGKLMLSRYQRGRIIPINSKFFQKQNILVFRIQGDPTDIHTGIDNALKPIWIHDLRFLIDYGRERFELALLGLYLFTGLYHLFLFMGPSRQRYNLYFGFFAIFCFLYFLSLTTSASEFFLDFQHLNRLQHFSLFMLTPILLLFLETSLQKNLTRFARGYFAFSGGMAVLVWLTPGGSIKDMFNLWWFITLGIYGPATGILMAKVLSRDYRGVRRQYSYLGPMGRLISGWGRVLSRSMAGNIFLGLFLILLGVVLDVLDLMLFFNDVQYTQYCVFIFIISIAIALANRSQALHHRIQEMNLSLERKVEDRTMALSRSLKELGTVKQRQDADYYLTSLLLQPVTLFRPSSRRVRVDAFTRQLKTFTFESKRAEIGGDINIVHTLKLGGIEHTIFANADAMGKSLQGASGALVLGVVFNAVVERSRREDPLLPNSPNDWLRECFDLLQTAFVSFDGSMMASVILGALDNQTGLLYYINAEHPFLILYRNGKASFIEKELHLYRIGASGIVKKRDVRRFQMEPEDTIISGSDGRDDVFLGFDEEGNRLINEDGSRVLYHVEIGGGELRAIYESLTAEGDLTDDLSLLSLRYSP